MQGRLGQPIPIRPVAPLAFVVFLQGVFALLFFVFPFGQALGFLAGTGFDQPIRRVFVPVIPNADLLALFLAESNSPTGSKLEIPKPAPKVSGCELNRYI